MRKRRLVTLILVDPILDQEGDMDPDPGTFENYDDAPPISIAVLLQEYTLFLADSITYTTDLYHDAAAIFMAISHVKC